MTQPIQYLIGPYFSPINALVRESMQTQMLERSMIEKVQQLDPG